MVVLESVSYRPFVKLPSKDQSRQPRWPDVAYHRHAIELKSLDSRALKQRYGHTLDLKLKKQNRVSGTCKSAFKQPRNSITTTKSTTS